VRSTKLDPSYGIQNVVAEECLPLSVAVESVLFYSGVVDTTGLDSLRERIASLEDDMSKVKHKIDEFDKRLPPVAPSVSLPPGKREEIKTAILKLLQENDVLDYVDIRKHVDVSLLAVVNICDELEKEGKIAPVAE